MPGRLTQTFLISTDKIDLPRLLWLAAPPPTHSEVRVRRLLGSVVKPLLCPAHCTALYPGPGVTRLGVRPHRLRSQDSPARSLLQDQGAQERGAPTAGNSSAGFSLSLCGGAFNIAITLAGERVGIAIRWREPSGPGGPAGA